MNNKLKINFYISTLIAFLLGAAFHFTYHLFNNNLIVGLFTPVNESVFEHLKLALLPITLWYVLFYILRGKKYLIDKNRWFASLIISIFISIIAVLSIYYFTKYGLNIDSTVLSISSLYFSILISQLISYHYYNYSNGISYTISLVILAIIFIVFAYLTINPPKIPLFEDSNTHTYGISNK